MCGYSIFMNIREFNEAHFAAQYATEWCIQRRVSGAGACTHRTTGPTKRTSDQLIFDGKVGRERGEWHWLPTRPPSPSPIWHLQAIQPNKWLHYEKWRVPCAQVNQVLLATTMPLDGCKRALWPIIEIHYWRHSLIVPSLWRRVKTMQSTERSTFQPSTLA